MSEATTVPTSNQTSDEFFDAMKNEPTDAIENEPIHFIVCISKYEENIDSPMHDIIYTPFATQCKHGRAFQSWLSVSKYVHPSMSTYLLTIITK